MSSATFPLINLPFEVLLHVVELLDCGDISSFCQVSRDLDAIASPVLYRTLKWDEGAGFIQPGDIGNEYIYVCICSHVTSALIPRRQRPCLAFRRRPLLRNYVRSVILNSGEKIRIICALLIHINSDKQLAWRLVQATEDRHKCPVDLQRAVSPAFVI